MQFLQVSEYRVRRYSGVLIGISVKISRIDSFSSSVICRQITEGSYLSIMHLLIGNRLQIFYWNNFRCFPINNNKNSDNTSQYKKTDPGQSGSAFPVLMIYAISDSGCLMLPGINVRRNIPLAAHIQIIRPPLHHGLSGLQMLCFMHICRPHAVALLVAHLPLHRIA